MLCLRLDFFFCFKQKTAYEMRISDWSSDVCSSDLAIASGLADADPAAPIRAALKPLIKGRPPALATLEEARALLRTVEAAPAHPMTKLASRLLALTALRQGVLRTTLRSEVDGLDPEEAEIGRANV